MSASDYPIEHHWHERCMGKVRENPIRSDEFRSEESAKEEIERWTYNSPCQKPRGDAKQMEYGPGSCARDVT